MDCSPGGVERAFRRRAFDLLVLSDQTLAAFDARVVHELFDRVASRLWHVYRLVAAVLLTNHRRRRQFFLAWQRRQLLVAGGDL